MFCCIPRSRKCLFRERKWYGTKTFEVFKLFCSCFKLSEPTSNALIFSLQELLEKYASETLIQQSQEAKTLLGL